MNKITYPLKQGMKNQKVADLQEFLLYLLQHRRDLVSPPPPPVTHVPRPPDWQRIEVELKREYQRKYYGKTTKWLVENLQYHLGLPATGVVNEPTANALNALLEELGLLEEAREEQTFVVRGRVVGPDLRGLSGWRVRAVDKNIGRDLILGEATTGEGGVYEIRYSPEKIRKGKEKPDVQVLLLDPEGKVLATSKVRYNAGPVERGLDIVVPEEKLSPPPEFRRLLSELSPQLGIRDENRLKQRLAELKEDDNRQEITYLANKTGWDARMVAMTALASRFSRRSEIEPEFFYALFRAGVPADESALTRITPETVQRIWERAIEQKILPHELKEKIPQALERFKQYSAGRLLEEPTQIGISNFEELIRDMVPDGEAQQKLARLYYERRDEPERFWKEVAKEFGGEVADRLQLNGKLAFLTINNGPLIRRLHERIGTLRDPVDLVRQGFFHQDKWKELLDDDVPVPDEIPGDSLEEKRANYAAFLAAQLRLSYPTAVVSERVKTGEIPVKEEVTKFLDEHQGNFDLGLQPVEQYLRQNHIELDEDVLKEIKKLQRVYQITPSDEAMRVLVQNGLDSAYAVVRYDEQSFVDRFKEKLGGEAQARLLYHKAQQVHNTVLNLATSYFLEKSFPLPYVLRNLFGEEGTGEETGVLAYPTLEELFGELDYCACEHCRSWLSPAAYLVDLLLFLDKPHPEKKNPLHVLLERRPDIQHLQLTCENTNTVLPYIDLVNEVLEHWVVNGALADFEGHNIEEGVSIEELLASPQFVNDRAYEILRDQRFPSPLPFHRFLEATRRYFAHFEVPLHVAMERLRADDRLERAGDIADKAYGWRDILMERLGLSRQEYRILTDSDIPLQALYGEDPDAVSVDRLIDELSNAKAYARRLKLTYEALIDLLRTQFVNPNSHLLPKLERLHVGFSTIRAYLDGTLSETDFEARLPEDLDEAAYGGDVKQWLRDHEAQIMGLIVLSDPTGSEDICSFDTVELRYADPDFAHNKLQPIEFLKLLRFIRLWKKLGWSIEQTDKAIKALCPADQLPAPEDDWDTARAKLDAGFRLLLDRLAHLQVVMERLNLNPNRDLLPLLACWASIDTHGYDSLYRQMFLNPTILALDPIFQEDGYGNYLADRREFRVPGAESPKLTDHAEALCAAFNLSREEFDLICQELAFDDETLLNLANISAVFRYGYLARRLRLSMRELLALKHLSGLDPFQPLDLAPPDPDLPFGEVRPPAIRFIEMVQQVKNSPFKVSALVYYLQHEDWSGKASPSEEDILAFARTLRGDLQRIERENAVQDDPTGEITKARMALVYPQDAVDTFFGFLKDTVTFTTDYSHSQAQLEEAILRVTNRIAYDDFRKQLTFRGVMTEGERNALQGVSGVSEDFKNAVQALYDAGQTALRNFFARYPELETPYSNFVSSEPVEKRFSNLLAEILPDLLNRLKRQQVRQTLSAQVGADLTLVTPLLEDARVLHAVDSVKEPAIADFLALETPGLSAEIFFADSLGDMPDRSEITSQIDYGPDTTPLPSDPTNPDAKVSGRWRGFLEAPENGFYNFYVEADTDAEIRLKLDGKEIMLTSDSGVWENSEPIELQAGRLYALELEAKRVKERLSLKWARTGMEKVTVPAAQLYPAAVVAQFKTTYLRVLKALAIAEVLQLSSKELAHFATHADYQIAGEGWLNRLPVEPLPAGATVQALFRNLLALLTYRNLKEEMGISDERLLEVLEAPEARDGQGVLLLERVAGWRKADLTALRRHFGLALSDLNHLRHLVRLHEAFGVVKKLGIGASALLAVITNEPDADTLRDLQAALRARYDDTPGPRASLPAIEETPARGPLPASRDWLKLIQPINDELRSLQRDALVAYVLHKMGQNPKTRHIDTPDKLFEHLLIDVQMDPCMKTSRIKQAISSVQLFIQRCLMNLEPEVASSDIKAKQWEWMKRYRIWEANRKVFLWPENWLEPELRDNKSPFFRDLESELLQGDITDEAAATALVHYLEKLDEVAKLEICGMYYEENELGNPADDVVHVIARTAGARRTYYYRRQEGGVTWTPWEKIDLNIEDNPVLPVVWNGRLFLFWLSVMQEVPPQTRSQGSASEDTDLTEATLSQLKGSAGEAKTRVTVVLYWSEYYNGKWQPPRTSDVKRPLVVGDFPATGEDAFDRSRLTLHADESGRGPLSITVSYAERGVGTFMLYNTHSLPLIEPWGLRCSSEIRRSFSSPDSDASFIVHYTKMFVSHTLTRVGCWMTEILTLDLLRRGGQHYQVVQPEHPFHSPESIFTAPFFFQDRRYVFFVRPEEKEIWVPDFTDVLVRPPSIHIPEPRIPPVLVKPEYILPVEPGFPPKPIEIGVARPELVEAFMRTHPYISRAIGMLGIIPFDDQFIGPNGRMKKENFREIMR